MSQIISSQGPCGPLRFVRSLNLPLHCFCRCFCVSPPFSRSHRALGKFLWSWLAGGLGYFSIDCCPDGDAGVKLQFWAGTSCFYGSFWIVRPPQTHESKDLPKGCVWWAWYAVNCFQSVSSGVAMALMFVFGDRWMEITIESVWSVSNEFHDSD